MSTPVKYIETSNVDTGKKMLINTQQIVWVKDHPSGTQLRLSDGSLVEVTMTWKSAEALLGVGK